ncbi:MAG: hypothetical protein K5637_02220 [Lachnospiraceae bacterium]|nr:hypothetical protein [Lachnospiraceae bacterium]
MKKLLSISRKLLCLALTAAAAFALSACETGPSQYGAGNTYSLGTETVEDNYAYTEISKSEFQETSYENIHSFFVSIPENDYDYYTIVFDDGTGICFYECKIANPIYGVLKDNKEISETLGIVESHSSYYTVVDEDGEPFTHEELDHGINGI